MASFWTTEHVVPPAHPLAFELVRLAGDLVAYGGLVLFVVAVLVALRRVRPTASLLAGGVRVSRLMALSSGLLATMLAASGVVLVHAGPGPRHAPLPPYWWPCVESLLASAVVSRVGAASAHWCQQVAEGLATDGAA